MEATPAVIRTGHRLPSAGLAALAVCLGVGGFLGVRHWTPAATGTAPDAQPADLLADVSRFSSGSTADSAITQALALTQRDGGDAETWVRLGDALMQKVRDTGDTAYYASAEQVYRKALARNANSDAAMTGLAWVDGGRHRFAQSTDWADKALAVNPQNNRAHGLLGDAALELGHYDSAYAHYQRMIDLKPDLSSYSRSAHLLHVTGQTFRAAWMMRQAIEAGAPSAENTAWCSAQLALIYFSDGHLPAAQAVVDDALQRAPNNRHLLAALGVLKAAAQDNPAAIAAYGKAIAIAPEHESLVALGDLYALAGDQAAAEAQYTRVEELHRRNHAASDTTHNMPMAQFYVDHDRNLVEALRLAEERKTTQNVFEIDILAWCYFKNGQLESARAEIERALKVRTPDAKMHFHAGMIYAALGDRVTAQKQLYQALSLNPRFSPVHAPVAVAMLDKLGESAAGVDSPPLNPAVSAGAASAVTR